MAEKRKHKISIVVEGYEITDWIDYQIDNSMVEPSDSFSMTRAFDSDVWKKLPLDARIRVFCDGSPMLDGFIDRRKKHSKESTIEIGGRDRAGRLVQESAPSISYNGLEMSEAVRRLADPWFKTITLSDARDRSLRRGKGFKVTGGTEPIFIHKVANEGRVHPGQTRWQVIEEILSAAGLICWSSGDGKELFIGRPNNDQPWQYHFRLCKVGDPWPSTVKELDYQEDIGDGYSVIAVVGNGGGTTSDFGESVSSRRAMVFDNAVSDGRGGWSSPTVDGTGKDFKYPKRLLMPERNFDSNHDALLIAQREQARRNFKRRTITVTMPNHGQFVTTGNPTLFTPNTIAWVQDLEIDPAIDGMFMIYACTYHGSRNDGEVTVLQMVPKGTEIVL